MENLTVNQVLELIYPLSVEKQMEILHELRKSLKLKFTNSKIENIKGKISENQNKELIDLLMSGPVMTKEEELNFQNLNIEFERWAKNLSV